MNNTLRDQSLKKSPCHKKCKQQKKQFDTDTNNKISIVFYLVGARRSSIFVFVRLAGNGVGALEARYGEGSGTLVEKAEK